jgi:multiple sugar transport system substrate-binding protein
MLMKTSVMGKVVASAAVMAMLCGVIAGCGSTEDKVQKEAVTLIVKCPTLVIESVSNSEIIDTQYFLEHAGEDFASQYDKANVTFDVRVFDYVDETEAITGSFDTEYAMDILYEDYFNMTSYVYTGRVVPLDDIITPEIRNDIDDTAWAISSAGGKTYMMPYLSRQNILIYNKKLMEDCGLGNYVQDGVQIQNWTTDEWTYILDTLAQNLPSNVYPMAMYGKNNQGDTHIMSLIRAFGSGIFDENGNFDFESDEAVNALSWIQAGVDKGWYPPHPENLEIADAQELFNNNQLVFYIFNNGNIILYDNLEDYGFVNFPGNVATSFVTGFEVFDNGDEMKIQVAKDFIKYIYETDKWLELSAGNIPESKKTAEKYADRIIMLNEFSQNLPNVVDFMNSSPNWQGNDTSVRSVFWPNIHNLLMKTVTPEECAQALDADCNKALEIGRESSTLHE